MSFIDYNGDKPTDFYDKKVPEVGSDYNCLAVMSLGYPWVLLKECIYLEKKSD